MIPLKLYMRNFMCYREQTLDFRGIHLACLTGSNGHGKSAILDAMTWALWGSSRLGARRDDELIHLGETEMEVEFEFELVHATPSAAGGIRYRAIRKRTRRRRGQSALELQGWDEASSSFRPLTEPTITKTQARINELLRMDYDTFINSAFLLQGRADEFTVKRPSERKRVLGDILGLGIYDLYEKRAKEASQQCRSRADQLLAAIEQIDQELDREPEYRADVQSAEQELQELRAEREQTQEQFSATRARLQEARSKQHQLDDLERRIAEMRRQAKEIAQELVTHQNRLRALQEALAEEAEIEHGFKSYEKAQSGNEGMNASLAESASLKEKRSNLEREIATARHEIDMERHSAAEVVQQLEKTASALDQVQEWQEVQAALARLDEREKEKRDSTGEIQETMAQMAGMQAENDRAEQDAAQTKEKIQLLSRSRGETHDQEAHCPLCGQPLPESSCTQLLEAFQEQLEAEREAYRQRNVQINQAQLRLQELKSTVAEIDRELHHRTGWQRKEAALAHVVSEAREAEGKLPAAQAALHELEGQLEGEAFAAEARAALRAVEQQLAELGYDADAHRAIQAELVRLRVFEERMQTLREARLGIEPERLAIEHLEQRQQEIESRQITAQKEAEELSQAVAQIPELEGQVLEARQILETAHDREQQASLRLGAARSKVKHCADLREQRVRRLGEEAQLREEQAIYQELQRAFGKNGVQAMLIEGAIPDIEEESNRLLARMSQGGMHVRFDTQRDTKTGETVETLDIHITDELGTRSYETYSGGERYRINFAIRIALSKLLAHRAGAQLQMLVIDEGFGTQDSEGREGVIGAINAVKDDFACILVITHIEELKDLFGVRIEVVKAAQGSEITVL